MQKTFTLRLGARQASLCLIIIFSLLHSTSNAQISLVKWEMQGLGPTVTPTTSLVMNNGKLVSAIGQTTSAFVTTDFCISPNQIFLCTGWNNGVGTSYYLANFSTTNYSSNSIKFKLTFLSEFGPRNFQTQYSITGPSGPWTNIGSAMNFVGAPGNCGQTQSPTISLPADCNNKPNVWVRVYTTENITITSYTGAPSWDDVEVLGVAMTAPTITTQPTSTTTCEGADATFTIVANNGISYQWEYRTSSAGTFINVPNNATYDNETTASLTVNNVTAAMSGYQYRCVVTGGTTPNATSNSATLTVNAYGTWNGSVNSNWNNAANWNCSTVPTATTNVTINSGGNQPIVNIGTAICNNLTINSGATLSFAAGTNQLEIKGTTSVAGTLNGAGGKVVFSGAASQTLPVGNYKDLEVNSSSNKTLGGNTTITGILSLNNGTITLNANNLTIASTGNISGATANSFIVTNGTGQLIQQSLGAGARTGSIIFPIGTSATSFTPLIISNTNGVADNFTVQVKDGIFTSYAGNTGSGAITTNSVNKTWFISEAVVGGSNATIQLTWNQANELAGFDRENCQVSHFASGFWQPGPYAFASGANPYTVSRSGLTSFSPFGVGSAGSPLPVELLSFTGRKTTAGNVLNWVTANEKSFVGFDVERSFDGSHYTAIGKVPSKQLSEGANYTFTDDIKNLPNNVFYRLKMSDENGASKYSTIVRLNNLAKNEVSVYPNPVVDGKLYVQLPTAVATNTAITIIDFSGRVVKQQVLDAASFSEGLVGISVAELPDGNYVLTVQDAGGNTVSQSKFVIQ